MKALISLLVIPVLLLSGCVQSGPAGERPGMSVDTAIVVDSIPEEYAYIGENACTDNGGMRDVKLVKTGETYEHFYDVITVVCNNGAEEDYYFQIDSFFGVY